MAEKKSIRTPQESAAQDRQFSHAPKDTSPNSPYKYRTHNSPLKDCRDTNGKYSNHGDD